MSDSKWVAAKDRNLSVAAWTATLAVINTSHPWFCLVSQRVYENTISCLRILLQLALAPLRQFPPSSPSAPARLPTPRPAPPHPTPHSSIGINRGIINKQREKNRKGFRNFFKVKLRFWYFVPDVQQNSDAVLFFCNKHPHKRGKRGKKRNRMTFPRRCITHLCIILLAQRPPLWLRSFDQ